MSVTLRCVKSISKKRKKCTRRKGDLELQEGKEGRLQGSKFEPTFGSDLVCFSGGCFVAPTRLQAITAMSQFSEYSFEELRWDTYRLDMLSSCKKCSSDFPLIGKPRKARKNSSLSCLQIKTPFGFGAKLHKVEVRESARPQFGVYDDLEEEVVDYEGKYLGRNRFNKKYFLKMMSPYRRGKGKGKGKMGRFCRF